MLNDQYLRIPLEQIHVRPDRQRRTVDVSDLLLSIRLRGVIQPVIVERSEGDSDGFILVAGERRYKASKEIGLESIPCRLASDLSVTERQILELEENVKRQDLSWQDSARAVQRIHNLYLEMDSSWTLDKTSEQLGISLTSRSGFISKCLQVAEALNREDKNVLACTGLTSAYNILARRTGRAVDDAMNDLLTMPTRPSDGHRSITTDSVATSTPIALGGNHVSLPQVHKVDDILNENFHTFASTYSGPPFNFLHCDFPYGINHNDSDQGGSARWGSYADSESTYWELCRTLCLHVDKLIAPSAHIMFWLSSDIERQYETLTFFRQNAPSLEFRPVPLSWHKTDNRGILSDPRRGPRQVVETALIASRGDRHVIKSVSNCYGAPTAKEYHQSEKPEPMLRYFFGMFVDENTRMFDPTCGSATSLRAAESMGARSTLGLEIDPEMVESARVALRKSRVLRQAEELRV